MLSAVRDAGPEWIRGDWHPWITVSPDAVFTMRYAKGYEFDEAKAAWEDVLRLSEAAASDYGFILDIRHLDRSEARTRAHVAECEKKINAMPSVQRYCRGVAVVVQNSIQRGALTAVSWLVSRTYELRVFSDVTAARTWLASRLGVETLR